MALHSGNLSTVFLVTGPQYEQRRSEPSPRVRTEPGYLLSPGTPSHVCLASACASGWEDATGLEGGKEPTCVSLHVRVHTYVSMPSLGTRVYIRCSAFCPAGPGGSKAPRFPWLAVLWLGASGSQALAAHPGVPYSRFACSGDTVEKSGSMRLLRDSDEQDSWPFCNSCSLDTSGALRGSSEDK